jgi:hypothetical protein
VWTNKGFIAMCRYRAGFLRAGQSHGRCDAEMPSRLRALQFTALP